MINCLSPLTNKFTRLSHYSHVVLGRLSCGKEAPLTSQLECLGWFSNVYSFNNYLLNAYVNLNFTSYCELVNGNSELSDESLLDLGVVILNHMTLVLSGSETLIIIFGLWGIPLSRFMTEPTHLPIWYFMVPTYL